MIVGKLVDQINSSSFPCIKCVQNISIMMSYICIKELQPLVGSGRILKECVDCVLPHSTLVTWVGYLGQVVNTRILLEFWE